MIDDFEKSTIIQSKFQGRILLQMFLKAEFTMEKCERKAEETKSVNEHLLVKK